MWCQTQLRYPFHTLFFKKNCSCFVLYSPSFFKLFNWSKGFSLSNYTFFRNVSKCLYFCVEFFFVLVIFMYFFVCVFKIMFTKWFKNSFFFLKSMWKISMEFGCWLDELVWFSRCAVCKFENDLGSSNLHQARCKLHFATQFGTPPVEPIFPKPREPKEQQNRGICVPIWWWWWCVFYAVCLYACVPLYSAQCVL